MQRKRSYVEAMEAGSIDDLLNPTNNNNGSAANQSVSNNSQSIVNKNGENNNSDQVNNNINKYDTDDTWSNDSVFEDNTTDCRSKSQDFDIYSSTDRNTVISVRRDFVSENDVNLVENTEQNIVDYKIDSEISENSNVSRGLSVVDELINEPFNSGSYRNSQHFSKKSLQNIEQNTTLVKEAQHFNSYNRESYENIEMLEDTPMQNTTLVKEGQNFNSHNREEDYDNIEILEDTPMETISTEHNNVEEEPQDIVFRDDPSFYEEREYNYDSDDMTLDFDETDLERGHRVSLTIPNTVTTDDNSVLPILYTGRNSVKKRRRPENCGNRSRKMRRLVFRNGETNIPLRQNIPSKVGKFMKDIVTTLIECQWRWITLIFSLGHFLLWLLFGLMFYVASYSNGDLSDTPPKIPCIESGRSFTAIFAFSVETQVSIGYGEKSPTEECPEVIFILVMEVIAGYALLGALVGIVYAKIVRPEKSIGGVGFSKHAVICMRDGQLCLVVRVWDTMGKHVIGTRVSAFLINHNIPKSIPLVLEQQNPVIMWPVTLQHNIVEGSPLYDTSAKDLLDQRFEIVFSITGSCRKTGQVAQSKTSYLPHNILWGQRFLNILSYNRDQKCYIVDHKFLNTVKAVDTPLCSARLLDEVTEQGPSSPFFISTPSSPSTLTSPGWSFRREYRPTVIRRPAINQILN